MIEAGIMASVTTQQRGRDLRRAILGALVDMAPPGSARVSLSALAARLGRRPTTVSFHVTKLARDGSVDSRPGPGGGVVLTAKGRADFDRLG